ncbi:branched-chain amino acid ABC transporter permease [Chloroflexi bacterium CFX6]|nr:branched-chain amino acid ABC transporter permease [Chloroflexi bacterium CFX6]
MNTFLRKNLILLITLAAIAALFIAAAQGMSRQDFVITLLRGLAVGSITFLVASGFSLIFGLLDVLNLAHGTLFMIGAYIGWTVFVRPDTFVDLLTPLLLMFGGFALRDVYPLLSTRIRLGLRMKRILPWALILLSLLLFGSILPRYPIATWNVENYAQSPVTFSFMANQGTRLPVSPATFTEISAALALIGLLVASLFGAFGLSLFGDKTGYATRVTWKSFTGFAFILFIALIAFIFNDAWTDFLFRLNSNWLFLISVLTAILSGAGLGALMEATLIRPLYSRPIYQLMLTLGMSAIGIEMVRAIWGRPEFVMPKPEFFSGTGGACPATNLADWWANHCSVILLWEGRVRVYNEIFIPLVGLVVLVSIWMLLQRTRLGMIIRAGVQDREMVEALGINVRRVFTMIFALGVGLAALGGALAAPSSGLSNVMGEALFLNALIALAIGGLTNYPGAALGSILVGLIQQFIIKYGQIGIAIPFTDIVFKPTPPLVPASTVLLMVIILLILPNGLLGRKE